MYPAFTNWFERLNLGNHTTSAAVPRQLLLLFQNKIVPVTGFLHLTDIKRPYALEGTPDVKDCEVEVKKGIHLTTYVKDVFPNAGRMTLSLDPNINKDKVGFVVPTTPVCIFFFSLFRLPTQLCLAGGLVGVSFWLAEMFHLFLSFYSNAPVLTSTII